MSLINEIKDRLSIFRNVYYVIRVIDPITKKILEVNNISDEVNNEHCYGFWSRNMICENCITMRAYIEDDTVVKLENKENKIFLITATPVNINNKKYIVEIVKDITQNRQLCDINISIPTDTKSIIDEMNDKIIKDELTGIYNRRFINERLPVDINKSRILGTPLSIIMTDIDFFKNINDNYGHFTGDKLLKDFASLLRNSIEEGNDWVARYGGDEFLIVLNNIDEVIAFKIAENIRKNLEVTKFIYNDITISITSSFGVYSITDDKLDLANIISSIDENLYKAKKTGRNKTVY